MFSLRNSGDNLANEFSKLLKKTASSQVFTSPEEMGEDQEAASTHSEENMASTHMEGDSTADGMVIKAEDFLLTPERGSHADSIDHSLDSAIDSFASSGHQLMAGLGKIASDLRKKGENFAADMVEATALSISKDLSKEANEKKNVVDNLSKIASDFDSSGDTFAGDMVRVTIQNIIDA